MPTALAGVGQMIERHLDANDVVSFVEHAARGERLARIESHLARCAECREEVSEASRLVRSLPARRHWRGGAIGAAAAAAVLFIFLWPRTTHDASNRSGSDVPMAVEHRGAPTQASAAPRPISPVGLIDSVPSFLWSSIAEARRYRVRVFDADGNVLWERETADTSLPVPSSSHLEKGRSYFWRVEAETGFDRHVASDLTEFVTRSGPRR